MRFIHSLLASLLICGAAGSALAGPEPFSTLSSSLRGTQLDRWYEGKDALRRGFDAICGDTFCEGDFANLTTVALDCGGPPGRVSACVWILGGSVASVDPATGEVASQAI